MFPSSNREATQRSWKQQQQGHIHGHEIRHLQWTDQVVHGLWSSEFSGRLLEAENFPLIDRKGPCQHSFQCRVFSLQSYQDCYLLLLHSGQKCIKIGLFQNHKTRKMHESLFTFWLLSVDITDITLIWRVFQNHKTRKTRESLFVFWLKKRRSPFNLTSFLSKIFQNYKTRKIRESLFTFSL